MSPMRLAGIDIGTLTCRLLIADLLPDGRLKELHAERRILRLGEGVDRTGRLNPDAMTRVLHCLKTWRTILDDLGSTASSVVATSAVRDAVNRDEFLDRVRREAGFQVEVISGEEEAVRTMRGVRSGLPGGVTDVLALDIGGGSTEFIFDRSGRQPVVRSINIGVVRLSERVLLHDPPTAAEIQKARDWIRTETEAAVADMPRSPGHIFVGTAGTITSLAAMAQKLFAYEPARIHNYRLSLETVRDLEEQLLARRKTDRVGFPGLEHGREDVIAAGVIMLRTIMDTWATDSCLVSDLGLREGVLLTLADRLPVHEAGLAADQPALKEPS